jgi:hypothetical protein
MGKVDGKFVILLDIGQVLSVDEISAIEMVAEKRSNDEEAALPIE